MPYILLLLVTLMWSFVGVLVKIASTMVDSSTITFSRFFIGILLLGLILSFQKKKLVFGFQYKLILIAAVAKIGNYYFENVAIALGPSYGNILVPPVQTVALLLVGILYIKERINIRNGMVGFLCLIGVFLISWNGLPLSNILHTGNWVSMLFILSGMGSAIHVFGQKLLVNKMDPLEMNFSIFLWSSIFSVLPIPFNFEMKVFSIGASISLIVLGIITALSFYLFTVALKKTSFTIVVILSNAAVIFTILWGRIFMNETITGYIILGTLFFLCSVVVLNIPVPKILKRKEHVI